MKQLNGLDIGRKIVACCEVQFLAQAVADHAQAVLRDAKERGNIGGSKVHFDQCDQPQVVGGEWAGLLLEAVEKRLVYLLEYPPELFPMLVVLQALTDLLG